MTDQNGSQPEPPKIEFPCEDYPVKVMGASGSEFYAFTLSVFDRLAPGYDPKRVTVKDSRNGTFQSITLFITATGVDQLQTLHETLRANPQTKMVL